MYLGELSFAYLRYVNLTMSTSTTVDYFLSVDTSSRVLLYGTADLVITGASNITGRKARVLHCGYLYTASRGAAILPGSTAAIRELGGIIDDFPDVSTGSMTVAEYFG